MIVFGHHTFPLDIDRFLAELDTRLAAVGAAPEHDALIGALVDLGEAVAAVADLAAPDRDDETIQTVRWESALLAIASAVCARRSGDDLGTRAAVAKTADVLTAISRARHPASVAARVAEGFAHYALYPAQYIAAAAQFAAATAPAVVTCIGIRGIGAPLAAVVTAELRRRGIDAQMRTVRPRGHPWDRRVRMGDALRATLRARAHGWFAIVDEGPGISGSSFGSTAAALSDDCGASFDRVALFPSWNAPAEALRSDRAQSIWAALPKYVTAFESVKAIDGVNLSAGAWRSLVLGSDTNRWPPVQPQHERRKYVAGGLPGGAIFRFAGLGRHGATKLARAEMLADEGFSARPIELDDGFLQLEWVDGAPTLDEPPSRELIERMAAYCAMLARRTPTGRRARTADLIAMIRHNLGEAESVRIEAVFENARRFDEAEVNVDGRMLPQEWIRTGRGWLKVDALDHHADDFLPCARDIAWDLAGAIVEWNLDDDRQSAFVDRYVAAAGDRTIALRLPFYLNAYAAYRAGYCTLAAETLGQTADGARFSAAATRYRRLSAARSPHPR